MNLSCGSWSAEIAPEQGANVIRLQDAGTDVLAPLRASNKDPFLVGSPLLFPANRTAGGKFCFEGQTYTLPIHEEKSGACLHGLLHTAPFTVLEQTHSSVRLAYRNAGEIYPFPFRMEVLYTLTAEGLLSQYRLTNLSARAMPYCFGLHTTFCEPARFSVPLGLCQQRDLHTALPTGRRTALNAEEAAYCAGAVSRGHVVSGYYTAAGDTAHIGSYVYRAAGFDHWVLYNAQGTAGILCVEPQRGCVNALNLPDPPVVRPGETTVFETRITKEA